MDDKFEVLSSWKESLVYPVIDTPSASDDTQGNQPANPITSNQIFGGNLSVEGGETFDPGDYC